ncbi:MAG TPA: cyclic nucleotide-binding domain-containing protein [Desulfuromonadaceae bacterium]|nr:cyclic nucleotide-binding domain-containing protein [Desulfuromonadaceae bacterium]
MQTEISILAAQPFLKGLSPQKLEVLVQHSMLTRIDAGQFIFHEGDPANRFYLILDGQVSIEAPIEEDGFQKDAVVIQTVGAGDVLGWSWLFPPYYWHFDARAVTPVKAIFLYGTALREYCESDHDLGYELMKRLSEIVIRRLQVTRRQLLADEKRLTSRS